MPAKACYSVEHGNLQGAALATFRTKVCEQHRNGGFCRDADRCFDSHCQTWQRRNPNEYSYSSKLCPEIEFVKKGVKMTLKRKCMRGRGCSFSHSKEEELYHPDLYKTKMCNAVICNRWFCPFAHKAEELRVPSSSINDGRQPYASEQCPASPMSASTTASSTLTVTSPVLACSCPSQRKTSSGQRGFLFEHGSPNDSGELLSSCHGYSGERLTSTDHIYSHPQRSRTRAVSSLAGMPSGSHHPPLTEEETRLYSNILITMLQREGLSSEEKAALRNYKQQSESLASMSTHETMQSSESLTTSAEDDVHHVLNNKNHPPPGFPPHISTSNVGTAAKLFGSFSGVDGGKVEGWPFANDSATKVPGYGDNLPHPPSSHSRVDESLCLLTSLLDSTAACPNINEGNPNSLNLIVELLKSISETPSPCNQISTSN